ncbi:sperm flagellar protein 1-like [Ostrinia furnacalis]|uniref:sperm flagellar protein 1-like n=1 Tax=Ostrinia furnacalis TaxID=93504 RepID=UPI00103CA015|nr:sperm flagellar protein 1-like [Ostrinia furnacalis]
MSTLDSPIPLSDIESVLAWVDTFKLSRPTKKINRDFSDAVLLAEILCVHYPKLVEMHNYPPRNSHALKLNNWMTLNRKVLKKLKLNLCCNTMEQLANCAPGVIERVLLMVRDKIRRDEELNKSVKDAEQNVSSGGSYYEACGDDENVLVVPVKTRVNGVLETVQQKVVSYDSYLSLKEELKDAKDSSEVLKQKVEHLDSLLKLKDERIDELQKQLDRKQARRKEVEAFQNSLAVPFETVQSPVIADITPNLSRKSSLKTIESNPKMSKPEESKIPVPKVEPAVVRSFSKPSITEVTSTELINNQINLERIKSDVFKEVEIVDAIEEKRLEPKSDEGDGDSLEIDQQIDQQNEEAFKDINEKNLDDPQDVEEFKDSEQDTIITIEETIQKEITDIVIASEPTYFM